MRDISCFWLLFIFILLSSNFLCGLSGQCLKLQTQYILFGEKLGFFIYDLYPLGFRVAYSISVLDHRSVY